MEKNEDLSSSSIVEVTTDSNKQQPEELIEIPPDTPAQAKQNDGSKEPSNRDLLQICSTWLTMYAKKFRGLHEERPKRLPWDEYLWTFIGSFLGIASVAFLHYRVLERMHLIFLIGSFGATAVLLFGAPRSPLAQPRNLIGGHLISAICGCSVRIAIDRFDPSVACCLAVALALLMMQLTETTHPPGGATALLAVTVRPILPGAHFLYILMPVLTGALAMLLVALIVNNLAPRRTYPAYWW